MNPNRPKLFLLDAMALAYRAYFAFAKNPIRNSKGVNTGAVLGFANSLLDILINEKPTHIAVAFDCHAPTIRHNEYAFYKANREAMPDELVTSIPLIKELVEKMGIPILEKEGYEADDIIGTFAKEAEKKGFVTFMMTPDKDFGQLVSDNIFMYRPAKFGKPAEVWGVNEVCSKFEIKRPEQVIDILAIWGDSSDNIPGIAGVGEVGAKKLVHDFDSVENMIENIDKIDKPAMKKKVAQGIDSVMLSKQLATIITNVPLPFMPSELEWKVPPQAPLQKFFTELEFRTLASRMWKNFYNQVSAKPEMLKGQISLFDQDFVDNNSLQSSFMDSLQTIHHEYTLVDNIAKLDDLLNIISSAKMICFDTETTSLDVLTCKLVGIAFSIEVHKAFFVYTKDENFAITAIEKLKPIFENSEISKCGHNLKFDIGVLRSCGINVSGPLIDTMLAHYILQPEMKHNLDLLSETYLNYQTVHYDQIVKPSKTDVAPIFLVAPERLSDYACEDADIALQLWNKFSIELKEQNMENLFSNVETPLIPVLEEMERSGVRIDTEALKIFSGELQTDLNRLEKEIYELAGHSFNIASPKQLGTVLFEELNIAEKPSKTKTKQYSTGEEILLKYVHVNPIVAKILDFRELSKLQNTYVVALPKLIHLKTNKIHTSFNQAVTATGRLSSSNPNLQNIPIRTERGKEIRKAFIPSDSDHVLVAADYSQVELRIIASISEDENMMTAFNHSVDIHTATAAMIYGIEVDDVSKEQRRSAKAVNFGIIYGMSAFGLAERLGISRTEAAKIIDEYFVQFPNVKKYMTDIVEFAKKNLYVETLMKRRRYLKDINSTNSFVRGFAERNAINAPIQGSSADMIKIAMINIYRKLKDENLETHMVLQVHDELVFDVPKNEIEKVKTIIETEMKKSLKLNVPVEVEIKEADNWLAAH